MLGFLRSRRHSRLRPTPEQAFEALAAGECMFSPATKCSGPLRTAGLRDEDDMHDVLVCRAHYGKLRRLDAGALETYGRQLERAFAAKRAAQHQPEREAVSWPRVMSR